ncbi:hypothetical protein [Serratia oryzae]|uniref:hypothetical protein n=1 Tax=Serratia oryzae TaxID=2034155 RepID=UPI0013019AC5|nr:hypothetical protein [Serratia oryzae]
MKDINKMSWKEIKSEALKAHIRNNKMMIPNYGEMHRYGEPVSTAFVESKINEVIA